ncbi:MAG: ferritin-like domain-containing protein [Desulfitobacterium sp.]|nr:ferritin-like domain-containing protein [Desulfitobacterium sp.]
MDKNDIIARLNWFYSLEINQVEIYKSQSERFQGEYAGHVFKRVALIEEGHVDNIAEKIRILGGTPSALGEVVSPLIGMSIGTLTSLTGLEKTLFINMQIERKAMEHYKNLIKEVIKSGEDPEGQLCKILHYNLVDEHLHTALFDTMRDSLLEVKIEEI